MFINNLLLTSLIVGLSSKLSHKLASCPLCFKQDTFQHFLLFLCLFFTFDCFFVCLLVCFGGGGGIHLKILIKIVLKGKGAHTYDIHMN